MDKRPFNNNRKKTISQPSTMELGDESDFGDLAVEDYLDPEVMKLLGVNVDEMIKSIEKDTEDKNGLQTPTRIVKIPTIKNNRTYGEGKNSDILILTGIVHEKSCFCTFGIL